jgi:hypothetical protein
VEVEEFSTNTEKKWPEEAEGKLGESVVTEAK